MLRDSVHVECYTFRELDTASAGRAHAMACGPNISLLLTPTSVFVALGGNPHPSDPLGSCNRTKWATFVSTQAAFDEIRP